MTNITDETVWLNCKQTAEALDTTQGALAQTRRRRTGPPFYVFGRRDGARGGGGVKYKAADVEAYLRARRPKYVPAAA